MGGSPGGGGTSTTVQKNDPPAYLEPYLVQAAQESQRLYNAGGSEFYPNQTYVDPSAQSMEALNRLEARANQGSPLVAQAQQYFSDAAGGKFANKDALDAQLTPIAQQFNNTVLPAIQSQYAKSGRYGSGAQAEQTRMAGQDLATRLGAITSENMSRERALQQNAAQVLPQMANLDYADIQALAMAGEQREGIQELKLREDINRFNESENRGLINLSTYINNLASNPAANYGTQYKNGRTAKGSSLAGAIGGGLIGAGAIGGLSSAFGASSKAGIAALSNPYLAAGVVGLGALGGSGLF